jgi:hypothetical protein
MKQKRIHAERDEIMDQYLRDELSDLEMDMFEEHLLYCAECRDVLAERSRMLGRLEKHAATNTFQSNSYAGKRSKKLAPLFWLAAAAGVALVIGLFLFPNRNMPGSHSETAEINRAEDSLSSAGPSEDRMAVQTDSIESNQPIPDRKRIATLAEYQVNPIYESQVGIHTRARLLMVEAPEDSIACGPGSFIEFKYRGTAIDSLFLSILDNQGEILFEEKIASPHGMHLQFPSGLYYWQLSDEEETWHTAKIIIR